MARAAAIRRLGEKQWTLKPQDLLVALKLQLAGGLKVPYAVLAKSVLLSPYEAHACVQRLLAAKLCTTVGDRPVAVKAALRTFLLHGARYCFPVMLGGPTIGFATFLRLDGARSRVPDQSSFVWPHPDGPTRGQALTPLYPKAPLAAAADAELYAMLCAFDQLRAGQTRERREGQAFLERVLA